MSAFSRLNRPKPGEFGIAVVNTAVQIGTGGTTVTDSTTTSVLLPVPAALQNTANAKAQLVGLSLQCLVAAASAGGTVLAQAFRRNNQGTPADVTLTAAISIEADTFTVLDKSYRWAITGTDPQTMFLAGDACRIDIVAASTLSTQPTLTVSGLWAFIN